MEVSEVWPVLKPRKSVSTEDGHPTALGGSGVVSKKLCGESGFYSKI